MPTRKPRGRALTRRQKAANRRIARRRVRIEHVNSRVKRCRRVHDTCRLRKAGVRDLIMEICCALHNFPEIRFVLWEMATAELGDIDAHMSQVFSVCQVDHILPRKPMIDISTCGFASEEEYFSEINRFGNLCLLEQRLNGGAGNVALAIKADYYVKRDLEATRILGHTLRETGFRRDDIERRVEKIVAFFRTRWPIAEGDAAPIPEENGEDSPG